MPKPPKKTRGVHPDGAPYAPVVESIKRTPGIKGLIGIFELTEAEYYDTTFAQKMAVIGHPDYEVLFYESGDVETDSERAASVDASGTGMTSVVRDHYRRLKSAIFTRTGVSQTSPSSGVSQEDHQSLITLQVIIHEMGHADDIAKGVNYNHESQSVDAVAAEVYAHKFACKYMRDHGYKWLLQSYAKLIKESSESPFEHVALAGKTALNEIKIGDLLKWTYS